MPRRAQVRDARPRDPDALTLAEAAAEAGYAYETFRKVWRDMATPGHPNYQAFPMPFRGAATPPGRKPSYAWRASAIVAWKLERETALSAPRYRPEARQPSRLQAHPRLTRDRADLVLLMGGRA